jgi:ABC-type lipoprotein export system ATPase subunit
VAVSAAAIELRDVFCVHRTGEGDAAALQGLSLKVRHGERLCVLGPSGAGKTSLLRVIAGLQEPSAGSVLVFGRDAGRLGPRERSKLRHRVIGFLDQHADFTLAPELRIADAVALPLALRGVRRSERRARAAALLSRAGLGDRGAALAGELSGGERQRVALCAALAHRPPLLLADEPTAELDQRSALDMARLIDDLTEAEGTTVIVVSHDPAMARHSPRVVRIRDGRVVEDRRDDRPMLVVATGGWIRLPADLLAEAGIGGSARAAAVGGGVLLTPADPDGAQDQAEAVDLPERPRRPVDLAHQPAAVQLRSVSRSLGRGTRRRSVIDGLSVSFEPSRLTVVTGRSGSGKTTLLELVAGMQRPDAGEVVLDGHSLGSADDEQLAAVRRERIGYLPQEPSPVGFLSAAENVALALRVRGYSGAQAAKSAAAVLARLGLAERSRQLVSRLSAGEAQRVALARAIACARGLLVVDEPSSRLDEASAAAVAQLLAEIAAGDGHTVICATHDPELVQYADRVLELGRAEPRSGR